MKKLGLTLLTAFIGGAMALSLSYKLDRKQICQQHEF